MQLKVSRMIRKISHLYFLVEVNTICDVVRFIKSYAMI